MVAGYAYADEMARVASSLPERIRQEIEQVPIQPGRLHEASQYGLLSLDVSELIGEVVTLHRAFFSRSCGVKQNSKDEQF